MKIGILTLPLKENYGGILQAVALFNYLTAQGHDVILIEKSTATTPQDLAPALKSIVRWLLLRIPFHDFWNTKAIRKKKLDSARRRALHRTFIETVIPQVSGELHTTDDLIAFAKKERFDAIIVGSDQVWRKRYINDRHYQSYFLDFVDGKTCKKIAYAASFGTDHWEGEGDAERIGTLLSEFCALSTREESGVNVCRNTFGYSNAVHLLDPTLIVDKEFYVTQVIGKHVDKDFNISGLLTYVLDDDEEKAKIVQHTQGALRAGSLTHLKGFDKSDRIYSVPEWVASFHNADFIVTDSFHGMLFSIIFEKSFIAIGNHGRGIERFTSLLSRLDLSDRLVFNESDLKPALFTPIDFKHVNEALLPLKKKSIDFLTDALKGNDS